MILNKYACNSCMRNKQKDNCPHVKEDDDQITVIGGCVFHQTLRQLLESRIKTEGAPV